MLGKRPLTIVLFAIVGLVMALAFWRVQQPYLLSDEQLRDNRVYILPVARELRNFNLVDHRSQPFTPERLNDRWSLVFLGFTHCPDICPTTMSQIGRHWDRVQVALPEGVEMQMVLVTTDPNRDSPQVMAEYVKAFHRDFLGVTGDTKELYRLATGLGLPFMPVASGAHADHSMKVESSSASSAPMNMAEHGSAKAAENYEVEHSGNVAIVNPCGHYVGFVRYPVDGSLLPAALATLAYRQPDCAQAQ